MQTLLLSFGLLVATSSFAAATGKITKLQGTVQRAEEMLKVGTIVNEGDELATGEKSFVRIKLNDGVVLQAGPSSRLKVLAKVSGEPSTIELIRGNVMSVIKSSPNRESYRVKTPNAVMGVRGTAFFVEEAPNKPTFLCVCEGGVAVRSGSKHAEKIFKTTTHTTMGINGSGIMSGQSAHSDAHAADLNLGLELKKEL